MTASRPSADASSHRSPDPKGRSDSLRKVAAELLTTVGWLSGTLHVPNHLPLEEHLALGRHDLKLTGVSIPNDPDRLRFVALRRDAVILVAPALPEEPAANSYSVAREVACLLAGGMLRGTLHVYSGLRLSDHLQLQGNIVTLRHCLLAPYGATANSAGARTLSKAIVNLDHAIGISESSQG